MPAALPSDDREERMDPPDVVLVWHRRGDLRLSDNALYSPPPRQRVGTSQTPSASAEPPPQRDSPKWISLYAFDPSDFVPRPSLAAPEEWDAVRVGPHASRLLLESVASLRNELRGRGGELLIRTGVDPAAAVTEMVECLLAAEPIGSSEAEGDESPRRRGSRCCVEVRWSEHPGTEEVEASRRVRRSLEDLVDRPGTGDGSGGGTVVRVRTECVCTLYHPDDVPRGGEEWSAGAHPKQLRKKGGSGARKGTESPMIVGGNAVGAVGEEYSSLTMKKESPHHCVDVSRERFRGMTKVMGDWRRSVRTKANVRQLSLALEKFELPTNCDFPSGDVPSLNDLLAPLRSYLEGQMAREKELKKEPWKKYNHDFGKGSRSILGLSAEFLSAVIQHAEHRHSPSQQRQSDDVTHTSEVRAKQRLDHFTAPTIAANAVRNTADTTGDVSAHLSHHLAFGTLSPRAVYRACIENDDPEGSKWLVSHMEMRDYFMFGAWGEGGDLFRLEKWQQSADGAGKGKKGKQKQKQKQKSQRARETEGGASDTTTSKRGRDPIQWKSPASSAETKSQWEAWSTGTTGVPLVDAAMVELHATGHCSNRVRQNCASVLTKDLHLDWRAGAELFQFLLEDFEVGANYGNWRYFSGVGHDPKERHFRTVSQAARYDPECLYVRKWIPALGDVTNGEAVLRPWEYPEEIDAADDGYYSALKAPIVDPATQLTWHDTEKVKEKGLLLCDD